jgi:D-sedoheptulose 7-phosphate isomerase
MFVERIKKVFNLIEKAEYTKENCRISEQECLALAHYLLFSTKVNKGCVYIIGNGGSTGIASHFCTDLLKALDVPAQTLFDSNLLTCIGNDLGYENVFSRQLKTLLDKNDVLVAISSSGKSPNIINAVEVANELGVKSITLSGFSLDNPLRSKGFLNMYLPACDYGLVETGHFSLLHTVIDTWKKNNDMTITLEYPVYDANKN